LDEPEAAGSGSVSKSYRGFKTGGGYIPGIGDAASMGVRGAFNNVLIFDKRTRGLTKVFEARTAINMFKLINGAVPRVIAFIGTARDSNKDGRLSSNDMQQLFIYSLDDGTLREVAGLAASVDDIEVVGGVDYLVVSATIDRNKNGEPERRAYGGELPEPTQLYRVDLKTLAVVPLVDDALVQDLQSTLDGTKTVVTK
jgi:hypothetical protein